MLKQSLISITLMLAALPPAAASPETAEHWGVQASEIYADITHILTQLDAQTFQEVPADFEDKLTRFAATASYLAVWTDETQSSPDLACIFRGMAEEVDVQLSGLETAHSAAQAKSALKRLAAMADDAQSIAVASAHAARSGETTQSARQCLSSDIAVDAALGHGS